MKNLFRWQKYSFLLLFLFPPSAFTSTQIIPFTKLTSLSPYPSASQTLQQLSHSYVFLPPSGKEDLDLPVSHKPKLPLPKGTITYYQKSSFPIHRFGFLSRMFIGDEEKLQYAIYQEYLGKKEVSIPQFTKLLESPHIETRATAALFIAWTLYFDKKNESLIHMLEFLNESIQYTNSLFLLQESGYLHSLFYLEKNQTKNAYQRMLQLKAKIGYDNFNVKLKLLYLTLLLKQKSWDLAQEVVSELRTASTHTPYYPILQKNQAYIAYHNKNYKKSITSYVLLQKKFPHYHNSNEINFSLAWLYYKQKRYDKSNQSLLKLSFMDDTELQMEASYLQFLLGLRMKHWDKAIRYFLYIPKDHYLFKHALRNVLLIKTQHAKFRRLQTFLLKKVPDTEDLDFLSKSIQAYKFIQDKKGDQATSIYQNLIKTYPNHSSIWSAHYNLSLLYLQKHQYHDALKILGRLLGEENNDQKPSTLYYLFWSFYQQKNYADIIKASQDVSIEKFPKKYFLHVTLILVDSYLQQGLLQEAQTILQQGIHDLQNKTLIKLLFSLYARQNQYSLLEKAFESNRKDTTLLPLYMRALLEQKKDKKAEDYLLQIAPSQNKNLDLWTELYLQQKKYSSAVTLASLMLKDENQRKQYRKGLTYLAEAQFFQKKYLDSFLTYQKIRESLTIKDEYIIYNSLVSLYYTSKKQHFLKEALTFLEGTYSQPNKYNITKLLAKYYDKRKQHQFVSQILGKYLKDNTYQYIEVSLMRIQNLYDNKNFNKCFEVAKIQLGGETLQEQEDRLELASKCSNQTKNQ